MFKIFTFTLKNNFKAVWMSVSVIAITLALIGILGNAIANMQETGMYSKEFAAVYNDLSSPYKEAFDEVLEDDGLKEIIAIDKIDSIENTDDFLEKNDYHTLVVARNINGKDSIMIESIREDSFLFTIGINFTNTANTISLISKTSPITQDMQNQYSNTVLKTIEQSKGYPFGVDYYGIQDLIQMSVLLAILGVFTVLDDKNKNLLPRMRTAPISRFKICTGRLLANVVYIVSIEIVIAVLSYVLYGVNWGENYLIILAVFSLYAICAVCVGMIAAVLTKSVMASIGIVLGIGSTLWPRYSGAFSPYYKVGFMAYTSPSFHAKNILFSSIYGGSNMVIIEGLLWMIGIAAVLIVLYVLAERFGANESI